MAKVRDEIVGKRFLSVSKSSKLKLNKITEWDWRAGVIRACTHTDSKHPELQVLVEYEDVPWQRREWIHVHRDQAFQILLIEHTLVWTQRIRTGPKLRTSGSTNQPALVFEALVDEVGLSETSERPLEYLTDRSLEFHDYSQLRRYKDGECLRSCDEPSTEAVRKWVAEQDGQRILCTTPSVLLGFRVQVYRSEGTTQWYTAVIVGYNETTRELTMTDDTVLEEHSEDPSLVHITIIGDRVVESILKGENVGITPRRSRSSTTNQNQPTIRPVRRDHHTTSTRGRKPASHHKLLTSGLPISPPSPTQPTSPTSPLSCHSSSKSHVEDSHSDSDIISSPTLKQAKVVDLEVADVAPNTSDKDLSEALKPSISTHREPEPKKESLLQHIYGSNINPLNSPSIPTNPDKPTTNPSKDDNTPSENSRQLLIRVRNCLPNNTSPNLFKNELPTSLAVTNPTQNHNSLNYLTDFKPKNNLVVKLTRAVLDRVNRDSRTVQGLTNSSSGNSNTVVVVVSDLSNRRTKPEITDVKLPGFVTGSVIVSDLKSEVKPENNIDDIKSSHHSKDSNLILKDSLPIVSVVNQIARKKEVFVELEKQTPEIGCPLKIKVEKVHLGLPVKEFSENNKFVSVGEKIPLSLSSNGIVRRVVIKPCPDKALSIDRSCVPDFIHNNSLRQVILLSSLVAPCAKEVQTTSAQASSYNDSSSSNQSAISPSISVAKSSPSTSEVPSPRGTIEVSTQLFNPELSLTRVDPSEKKKHVAFINGESLSITSIVAPSESQLERTPPKGTTITPVTSGAQNLGAAGAVSGRAVTITATSGPAPQGSSRVASPPSVSITAVVRSPDRSPAHDGAGTILQHPPAHFNQASVRMDQGDGSSDSGVSVTERSVSRSSVLSDDRSSSAEVKPNTPTPVPLKAPLVVDRKEPVKVWRNPAVLSQPELSVRHIHSLQHSAMSQHFPGVPPSHVPAPPGPQAHPSSHGPHPPPPNAGALVAHTLPLHYPGHHVAPHPLAVAPVLNQSLNALYQNMQMQHQQQQHANPLVPHAYPSILHARHPEEISYLEHQAREIEKQRERRELDKLAKEKMERERQRKDRERRDREERSRRQEWGEGESDLLVNQHFHDSFRFAASQKLGRETIRENVHPSPVFYSQNLATNPQSHLSHSQNPQSHLSHSQSLLISQQQKQQQQQQQHKLFQKASVSGWGSSLNIKSDARDHRQPPSRHPTSSPHSDVMRKSKETDQFVKESIYKAFRADEPGSDPHLKPHTVPPPAHSKHPLEMTSIGGIHYGNAKELKHHERSSALYQMPHDKAASVIVQPDLKYGDKVSQHSVSPKQKPLERSNPYSSSSGAPPPNHHYKYEQQRVSHHPASISPSLHSVELTKIRQPPSSPHTPPSTSHYPPGTKAAPQQVSNPYSANHLLSSKSQKVSSPPLHMYGKPGIINSSSPICPMEMRPLALPAKSGAPPPAHTGSRNHEARTSSAPHEQRHTHNRSPFDSRMFAASVAHNKSTIIQPPNGARVPAPIQHQVLPLDLGRREDTVSPAMNRRRSHTPTPQEVKKPRLEATTPLLSRVSEPSPLYPTAATTITTVENTVALANLHRVSSPNPTRANGSRNNSPVYEPRPASQPPRATTPNSFRTENNFSPSNLLKQTVEPEQNSSSPRPSSCYVHKLKKAWLQRHESLPDMPTTSNARALTPSPKPAVKQESKRKVKSVSSNNIPNGHSGQDSKEMDTTSTDSEDSGSHKSNKRGKMSMKSLKRAKKSTDESDSDKESDGSESGVKKPEPKQDAEPRKRRGRKPKIKTEKDEKLRKSSKNNDPMQIDPLLKPPVAQLKKTGESFLQSRSCYEVAPKLPKCRECRWTAHQRNKKMPNIFCRFYAFRRLRYIKSGQLAVAGFSDPVEDAFGEDLRLWKPDPLAPAQDREMSKFLINHVGDQFCDLVQQEKQAMTLHMGEDTTVAWKRVVQGVREMCDVCETTLFNVHWACSKCGFVVCIDCYKCRKEGKIKSWDVDEGAKERDKYSWLLCASRVPHEQDKLMLTQIIAGNALTELGEKIHEERYKWGIAMYCSCPDAHKYKELEEKKLNGINKELLQPKKEPDIVNGGVEKRERIKDEEMSNSPLDFFADVALSNDKRESETSNSDSDSDSDKDDKPSTLRELLVRPNTKSNLLIKEENKIKDPSKKKAKIDTLDDVISCVIDRNTEDNDNKQDHIKVELKHFVRKYNYNRKGRDPLPIRIMTKTESRLLYPGAPHSWLCDGKLLHLEDHLHKDNMIVFQDQWKRGQPVMVSGVGQALNPDLWKPYSFTRDFGENKNNLINCLTDNIVPNQPMKKFWDGFENYGRRLKDEKGQPMVLKMKDWPPGDDFAELLPSRFEDLMKNLPMGEYTRRNGYLNLAGRLPECFVRPDLGPKMYIAYGSASFPGKASTNLHLDISDAVNVMCYVGLPKDLEYGESMRDTLTAIDDAGADVLTRQRVREKDELPGALWHIYHSRDSDKIRDLLNKVAIERGKKLEPFHDPIHDQSWYLDGPLRKRLYDEYSVEGYAIVQCMGDALFIPAGAPHQVRNLLNCVKVAEDFVSPENIAHCFHLTEEFRHLSDNHTNHEDKLQIKNIIYHAMKDSLSALIAPPSVKEEAS